MIQSEPQYGTIDEVQSPHHGVCLLSVKLASQQKRAEHGYERNRDDCCAHHGEGLGECQRMKEFSFFAGEGENRNEGEDYDRHRKEDWTPYQPGRFQNRLPNQLAIFRINLALFNETERVFCYYN